MKGRVGPGSAGQTGDERLRALSPEERRAFCQEVMERLSDLVEGEAPEDFCTRVEEILGRCQPFLAYRNTLEATIRATHRLGEPGAPAAPADEEAFARCVERVRRAVAIPDRNAGC